MRRLVVTADDFGLCPGVVSGVIQAFENGIVTSTSLMVNAPSAEAAFAYARENPSLATGLHFVLTFGRPIGPVEPLGELLDEGGRFRRSESGVHARVGPARIRGELRAQLGRFRERVGREPTHIDGHHHVHVHPGILRAVIDEAGPIGVPVRAPDETTRERLRIERIRTTDHFIDRFYGADRVDEPALVALLKATPAGTSELMCHPAEADDSLVSLSGYVEPRFRELRTLTSKDVRKSLEDFQIELASWA